MGADRSSTARVQRGPSKAARGASTEDHQAPSPPFRAGSTNKKDGLVTLYPTLEKYEWDVSYTRACRRLRQQRGQPSRIKPGSMREESTRTRTLRTISTS